MDCECTKNEKIDCQASKGLKGYRMGGDGVKLNIVVWLTGRMIRRNMTMFVEN